MPDNARPTSTPEEATGLPRWFVKMQTAILSFYCAIIGLCIAGVFLIGFVGMIVYRDFDSYTLAGNPWAPSDFPWYVMWPMRLMSMIGVMVVAGLGFVAGYVLVLRVISGAELKAGAGRRLVAALITLALEFILAAWLMHWIG